jgi:hypothetical protein
LNGAQGFPAGSTEAVTVGLDDAVPPVVVELEEPPFADGVADGRGRDRHRLHVAPRRLREAGDDGRELRRLHRLWHVNLEAGG